MKYSVEWDLGPAEPPGSASFYTMGETMDFVGDLMKDGITTIDIIIKLED